MVVKKDKVNPVVTPEGAAPKNVPLPTAEEVEVSQGGTGTVGTGTPTAEKPVVTTGRTDIQESVKSQKEESRAAGITEGAAATTAPTGISGITGSETTATGTVAGAEVPFAGHSLKDVVSSDHRLINKAYEKYQALRARTPSTVTAASGGATTTTTVHSDDNGAEKWKNHLIREMSRMSSATETVFFPEFVTLLGEHHVDQRRRTLKVLREQLDNVDKTRLDEADFDHKLARAVKYFNEYASGQLSDISTLEEKAEKARCVELQKAYREQKDAAPTHPHPSAPLTGGMLSKVAETVTKPLDTLKDKARSFPSSDDLRMLAEE
jgi:hypothetical protein